MERISVRVSCEVGLNSPVLPAAVGKGGGSECQIGG